jgi:nitrate/nitrite transporter NarK
MSPSLYDQLLLKHGSFSINYWQKSFMNLNIQIHGHKIIFYNVSIFSLSPVYVVIVLQTWVYKTLGANDVPSKKKMPKAWPNSPWIAQASWVARLVNQAFGHALRSNSSTRRTWILLCIFYFTFHIFIHILSFFFFHCTNIFLYTIPKFFRFFFPHNLINSIYLHAKTFIRQPIWF